MTISIVLVDDHTIFRQGLRALLANEKDFVIVGEAWNSAQAVELSKQLCPDVIILDVGMPDVSGLAITHQIRVSCPATKILILSMHEKEAYVAEAIKNGANGYIMKGADSSELIAAIQHVIRGKFYLGQPFTEESISAYLEKTRGQALDLYDTLTIREKQVLLLSVQGLSNPEIAEQLVLSTRTIETHRANMMHKLNLGNQSELVRYAISKGLLVEEI